MITIWKYYTMITIWKWKRHSSSRRIRNPANQCPVARSSERMDADGIGGRTGKRHRIAAGCNSQWLHWPSPAKAELQVVGLSWGVGMTDELGWCAVMSRKSQQRCLLSTGPHGFPPNGERSIATRWSRPRSDTGTSDQIPSPNRSQEFEG